MRKILKYNTLISFLILILLLNHSCRPKNTNTEVTIDEKELELYDENGELLELGETDFYIRDLEDNYIRLADLKGKYLYVDVWATWCGPCRQQFPTMRELEQKYRDTNIQFVSISVDKENKKDAWLSMVEKENLEGVQLFVGEDPTLGTTFHAPYIPKFLIIGKNGEVINADAPRPMDHRTGGVNQELVQLLDKLNNEG